jgi:endonuclease-3
MKYSECPFVSVCTDLALRVERFLNFIERRYPSPSCALIHLNPYELLCATILSAQCTDKQVNKVTPALFAAYPTPASLAEAVLSHVEELIKSTGFYHNKAKSLVAMAKKVTEEHGGEIPRTIEELEKLPGVGRKTANVVLGNAFDTPAMVVDTHVLRISNKLGFADSLDPYKVETELVKLIDRSRWVDFSHQVILLGRELCTARNPRCESCLGGAAV